MINRQNNFDQHAKLKQHTMLIHCMGLNTHLCIIAHLELIEISKDRPNYEYSRMIHSTSSIFVYNTHNMHTNAIALHSHTLNSFIFHIQSLTAH